MNKNVFIQNRLLTAFYDLTSVLENAVRVSKRHIAFVMRSEVFCIHYVAGCCMLVYYLYAVRLSQVSHLSQTQWRRQGGPGGPTPSPPILQTKNKHTFKVHKLCQFGQFIF